MSNIGKVFLLLAAVIAIGLIVYQKQISQFFFAPEGLSLAAATDPETHYRLNILPAKLAMQADYAENRTATGDIAILFRTLGALRG